MIMKLKVWNKAFTIQEDVAVNVNKVVFMNKHDKQDPSKGTEIVVEGFDGALVAVKDLDSILVDIKNLTGFIV